MEKETIISIWDSGTQYKRFDYDIAITSGVYGFDDSDYKNRRTGNTEKSALQTTKGETRGVTHTTDPDVEVDEPSWQDFTRNTTFHGMKYVFDSKPIRIRR